MLFVECAQREIMLKVVQMAYCCTIMHIKQYSVCGRSVTYDWKRMCISMKEIQDNFLNENFTIQ